MDSTRRSRKSKRQWVLDIGRVIAYAATLIKSDRPRVAARFIQPVLKDKDWVRVGGLVFMFVGVIDFCEALWSL